MIEFHVITETTCSSGTGDRRSRRKVSTSAGGFAWFAFSVFSGYKAGLATQGPGVGSGCTDFRAVGPGQRGGRRWKSHEAGHPFGFLTNFGWEEKGNCSGFHPPLPSLQICAD